LFFKTTNYYKQNMDHSILNIKEIHTELRLRFNSKAEIPKKFAQAESENMKMLFSSR
jgi:hypothetical protein